MFVDICSSSGIPAETLPEQDRILRSYTILFSELISIVEDYDGTVEKNTGDGLMAYFVKDGPTSDAHKAVACALTMFQTAELALNPLIVADEGTPIQFRVCIDRGPITVAEVGAPRGFRGAVAIGTTANIASKMLAHAGPMELVIGQAARNSLPPAWAEHFTSPTDTNSGWEFRVSKAQYLLYKYVGRWSRVLDE